MSKISAEISTIRAEPDRMSALDMSAGLLREIAGDSEPGEQKQEVWSRLYDVLSRHSRVSWTYNRVRDIWKKDERVRISGDELLELQRIAASKKEAERVNREHLEARLEAIEARLNSMDPDLYREGLVSLRRSVGRLG